MSKKNQNNDGIDESLNDEQNETSNNDPVLEDDQLSQDSTEDTPPEDTPEDTIETVEEIEEVYEEVADRKDGDVDADMASDQQGDQGFEQRPVPLSENSSGGKGMAGTAMGLSLLALAGTGYNLYDASSSESADTGGSEQTAVDYSTDIASIQEQIKSLMQSQEELTAMAGAAQTQSETVNQEDGQLADSQGTDESTSEDQSTQSSASATTVDETAEADAAESTTDESATDEAVADEQAGEAETLAEQDQGAEAADTEIAQTDTAQSSTDESTTDEAVADGQAGEAETLAEQDQGAEAADTETAQTDTAQSTTDESTTDESTTDEVVADEQASEAETMAQQDQQADVQSDSETVASTEVESTQAESVDEQDQEAEIQARIDALTASLPSGDEIKKMAMEQVSVVLEDAKKRLGLSEVAQLLSIGEQRLALAGDVGGAQAAFGMAQQRLSEFSDPVVEPVRESISSNLAELESLEVIDKNALTQELNNLSGSIDTLAFKPLETLSDSASEEQGADSSADTSQSTESETQSTDEALSMEGAGDWIKSIGSKMGSTIGDVGSGIADDLKGMVKIQKTGSLTDVMLATDQQYFVRENIKLQLGTAQRAVLQENTSVYKQSLTQAQSLLNDFFDVENDDVKSVVARLSDLEQINLELQVPDISAASASLAQVLKQLPSVGSSETNSN